MGDIRDVFRDSLYETKIDILEEGKGRNKAKKRHSRKADRRASDKVKDVTSINQATGVKSGDQPIGKYGNNVIPSKKDKANDKRGKEAQKAKKDLKNYDESIASNEDLASEDLLNELVTDFENDSTFQFNEETVTILKDAFMAGFLSSSKDNNGDCCKAVYKNSALKPDAEVWNNNLKERFRRFVYNEKKKLSE